jgi:hypothetical protein
VFANDGSRNASPTIYFTVNAPVPFLIEPIVIADLVEVIAIRIIILYDKGIRNNQAY